MLGMSPLLRNFAKAFSLAVSPLALKRAVPSVLMYHSVCGDAGLELDVRPNDFRAHVSWLESNANVVPLERVFELWSSGMAVDGGGKPYVALTFDDAYDDFYRFAWPLLRSHGMPVTLYVPTRFIDSPECVPLSRLKGNYKALKPMTWDMLREVAACPLVELAAHSHDHNEYTSLSSAEVEADIRRSIERFRSELGFVPKHFAYPRGAWDARVESIVSRYFDSAVLVGFDPDTKDRPSRFRVGRVAVLRSDRGFWFPHRVRHKLELEENVSRALRLWKRRRGNVVYD